MTAINEVQIDQRFSFEVYPTEIIGNGFKDMKMEGVISARTAASFGVDIVSMHAQVYPSLPAGVPNDPYQYSWVRLTHANGVITTLGVPWIRAESITVQSGGRVIMTFENKTQSDIDRMVNALSSNGYSPNDVRVEST